MLCSIDSFSSFLGHVRRTKSLAPGEVGSLRVTLSQIFSTRSTTASSQSRPSSSVVAFSYSDTLGKLSAWDIKHNVPTTPSALLECQRYLRFQRQQFLQRRQENAQQILQNGPSTPNHGYMSELLLVGPFVDAFPPATPPRNAGECRQRNCIAGRPLSLFIAKEKLDDQYSGFSSIRKQQRKYFFVSSILVVKYLCTMSPVHIR